MAVICVRDFTSVEDKTIVDSINKRIKKQIPNLHKILNGKNIKHRIYQSKTCKDYLIMVHLLNDWTAQDLGKKHEFPRGFPIIYNEVEGFHLYGFHPKFKNDEQKQTANLAEFSKAQLMHLTLKYSGFLGQTIVWKSDGNYYWTCTSKNAVGNEFSVNAVDIINKIGTIMTPDNVKTMYDDGKYWCGEVMSELDQCHGEEVLEEAFVCTCVGEYGRVPADQTLEGYRFSHILNHVDMHKYCIQRNIPVAELWIVSGAKVMEIATELSKYRDRMTMAKLRQILSTCECLESTVKHESVLSDTIEGLVIWLYDEVDGKPRIIKYKFPIYTTRTFGLRAYLALGHAMLSTTFKKHVDKYLDFWVTTKEGRDYWRQWLYTVALSDLEYDTESPVGKHIQYANQVVAPMPDAINTFNQRIGLPLVTGKATVVVLVGPIGAGKSTHGNYLETEIPNSQHIDGDHLYKDVPTMELGKERNIATLTQIMDVLIDGKIPIISCGGGVLFNGNDVLLDGLLREKLGLELDLVLYVPCSEGEATKETIRTFYNTWKVDDVIKFRLSTGLWHTTKSVEGFVKDIQKLSVNNLQFAQQLVDNAREVLSFKPIIGKGGRPVTNVPTDLQYPPPVHHLHLNQLRLMVRYSVDGKQHKVGHFTIHYSDDLRKFDTKTIQDLRRVTAGPVEGALIQAKSPAPKKPPTISFIALKEAASLNLSRTLNGFGVVKDPQDLHVTVSAGKHMPHQMKDACHMYLSDKVNPVIKLSTKDKKDEITYTSVQTKDTAVQIVDVIYT